MTTFAIKTNTDTSHKAKTSTGKKEQKKVPDQFQGVEKPLFSPMIQTKLTIGQPGDKYEQEADAMAERVVQRLSDSNLPPTLQTKCDTCEKEGENKISMMQNLTMAPAQEKEEDVIQTKAEKVANTVTPSLESRLSATKGGGSPLPGDTMNTMNAAFGAGFSGVRIHTDASAVQMNRELGAKAFTNGSDIYFNAGNYDTQSKDGQFLLAHELAHVVQQENLSGNEIREASGSDALKERPDNPAIQLKQEEFVFSEGESLTSDLEKISGTGESAGEREVEDQINKLRNWVPSYLGAYRDGLNNFSDTMNFASDQETHPRFFDVALKEVGKILLDELIDYAISKMGIVGPLVKGAKSVLIAVYEEAQKANLNRGEAKIRDYIVSTRNEITKKNGIEEKLLEIMDSARPKLLEKYRDSVNASGVGPQGENGYLVGEAALFIRDLKSQVEKLIDRIPTAAEFQKRFTEKFADTQGRTPLREGYMESGSLHFHMHVYREKANDKWETIKIESADSSWKLATLAPKVSRLAQSLQDSIEGDIANTSLPKYLHVKVETEIPWLNKYEDATVYFRNPSKPEFRGWDKSLSKWVWNTYFIKRKALSIGKIT